MVARRGHGTNTIRSSWQPTVDGGAKSAISISGVVDTLEESERARIRWLLSCKVFAERLDSNMSMSNDLASVELLGSRIVGVVRVSECSGLEVVDLHVDVEILVGFDVIARSRVLDDR